MKHLVGLFNLLEYTRAQPQYGYVLSGVRKQDLSNLAEHHYLVTFIAWQLALQVKAQGARIDIGKVLEFGLIHDLGELFGGDIAMPYAKANPKAREHAKAFEAENQKYLAGLFGDQSAYFQTLSDEIMNAQSDESILAKIADYLEVTHYKKYVGVFADSDLELITGKLTGMIEKMHDQVSREFLQNFIQLWLTELPKSKPFNQTLS